MLKIPDYLQEVAKYTYESSKMNVEGNPNFAKQRRKIVEKALQYEKYVKKFETEEEAYEFAKTQKKCAVWCDILKLDVLFYANTFFVIDDEKGFACKLAPDLEYLGYSFEGNFLNGLQC